MMTFKVKLQDGVFIPMQPVPDEWRNGDEFDVGRNDGHQTYEPAVLDDESWKQLEDAVAEISNDEFRQMQVALDQH